jgi:hypothetical protein
MNRLQKFVEKGAYGEGPLRTAYVLDMNSLPMSTQGTAWHVVDTFRAGDDLLDNPGLKDIYKLALEKGCAIVTPKAKGK